MRPRRSFRRSGLTSSTSRVRSGWWLEGVEWLEWVIRSAAADPEIELVTAGDYVTQNPVRDTITLPEGSWGNGGDHRTWLNQETEWTWPEIRTRQRLAETLLRTDNEATRQLARELLLLQSSDWQFLMTTGQAHDYAIERFESHKERFDRLADAINRDDPQLDALVTELLELDNPFPAIEPALYRPIPTFAPARR
jgi:1,4-alpha-glucan branching enzyme